MSFGIGYSSCRVEGKTISIIKPKAARGSWMTVAASRPTVPASWMTVQLSSCMTEAPNMDLSPHLKCEYFTKLRTMGRERNRSPNAQVDSSNIQRRCRTLPLLPSPDSYHYFGPTHSMNPVILSITDPPRHRRCGEMIFLAKNPLLDLLPPGELNVLPIDSRLTSVAPGSFCSELPRCTGWLSRVRHAEPPFRFAVLPRSAYDVVRRVQKDVYNSMVFFV